MGCRDAEGTSGEFRLGCKRWKRKTVTGMSEFYQLVLLL